MKELYTVIQQVKDLQKSGLKFVLATVVRVEGSAYRRPGARMLIAEDGNWWGGISGGCLEGDILKKAQLALFSQNYKTITYDTREEDPFALGIGLGCNGKIVILINPFKEQIISFCDVLKKALDAPYATWIKSIWNFAQSDLSSVVEMDSKQIQPLSTQFIRLKQIQNLFVCNF